MNYLNIAFMLSIIMLLFSCTSNEPKDNQTAGSIKISIDETYKPVMEEQLKIFTSRFPNAHILAEYKPENDCLKDFFEDTTRVIFITRELTQEEKDYALSKQIVAKSMSMARDAIVFIMSKAHPEPKFTMAELRDILTGVNKNFQIVFDNKNSSTVRYVNDSILNGQKLSDNIFATNNSEEVIHYIEKNDKAIGVIGVSWIADHKDSTVEQFLKQVNIAAIKPDADSINFYVKPYQAYIGLKEYPCTREFYFISKETWPGLGTGLVNYLCRDGQIVFKQAKMFPLRVNVLLKNATVNE
ncbi:MAG: substrate-binding domain-containing protein [Chitinophagaceae bacterium]|nr:substrate-binding domain-containing protein [Chitinophagaceae bacterium]HMN33182.1 substrate-binding domain-containing protein [Chitinophagaceae bacterium]